LLRKLSKSKTHVTGLQSSRSLARHDNRSTSVPNASLKGRLDLSSRADPSSELSSDDDLDDTQEGASLDRGATAFSGNHATNPENAAVHPLMQSGSGLKRPLEVGEDGFPVMKSRRKKPKIAKPEELPWEGFSSEDDAQSENGLPSDKSGSEVDEDISEISEPASSEDSSSPEISEDDESEDRQEKKARASAFKKWATQQMNEVLDFRPSDGIVYTDAQNPEKPGSTGKFVPRPLESDPLPQELQASASKVPDRKAFSVKVDRPPDIQEARLGLPIVAEEQKIMEAIYNNSVVVVWGATGSGKTTQLPQFLFEAGFGDPKSSTPGMIGITQPRRVAAVSMAKRVSEELSQHKERVSYQIRFENTASSKTAIKFMTDGILLREVAQDFALTKYSVIVIDEAHERSVNTDILIGMVSRIVDLRATMSEKDSSIKPLKFVIMSATLRITDFTQNPHLFRHGQPPLVQAEGRQYPVTTHFARRTNRDYVGEAFRKVSKGHRKLPQGGILVFLTGQNEIRDLSKRLTSAFSATKSSQSPSWKAHISATDAPLEVEDVEIGEGENVISDNEESDVEITGVDEANDNQDFEIGESVASNTLIHVLPLYSQLPTKEQLRIFEKLPEGSRLIVIATNVAETSLTIPGIRYVFDCGRSKEKQYDQATGVQSFQIGWISKASASQRAGRAGRTGPGHCYRLYSSAVYERDFAEHTEPEVLRTPIEGVVLQMKSIGLDNVVNFPFPTPPDRDGLARAEKLLQNLGAISIKGHVTEMGRGLSVYPLTPRYGKMLHIGNQHGCMPYVIALVSALSVSDLFIPENQLDIRPSVHEEGQIYTNESRLADTAREERRKAYNRAHALFNRYDQFSDALKLLTATCAYAYASEPEQFCTDMFLRSKAMKETVQLRRQLTEIARANHPGVLGQFEARLPEPSDKQIKALKQILATGFVDQVSIRADLAPSPPDIPRKPKRSIDIPYLTLLPSHAGGKLEDEEKTVYIHPSSILAHVSHKELPQYLIYSHLQRGTPSTITSSKTPKTRMFPLTSISGAQLSALAHDTPLLNYGKPIGNIKSLGGMPERRECWVIPSLVGEKGSLGWPLPARKVVQRKGKVAEGWIVEKFLS
jgi:ATP-dependent RNA helicase DHX37/DHR1